MATATIQTTCTKQVTLVLSEDEAIFVKSLVGQVTAPSFKKWRNVASEIYRALHPVHVIVSFTKSGCIPLSEQAANEV